MNKILLAAALAALATAGVSAKTADQLRVYINPGHGSWTGDDRPQQLVNHPNSYTRYGTDTLSFFESNTDLEKGFGVLERLIQYGLKFDRTLNQTGNINTTGAARDLSNNIVMSRVKNGPYHSDNGTSSQLGDDAPSDIATFNRNLTEIAREVESNNFDMFISIHSNATSDNTTNIPLYLYRGYDDCHDADRINGTYQQTSRNMAEISWPYLYNISHMSWSGRSLTNTYIKGDLDFYGSNGTSNSMAYRGYLGVLKHSVPGFLVEGYFHTYEPARHRAMNWDVDRVEGIAYARGIAEYFGLATEKTGTIYGIVRDKYEKFADTHYTPRSGTEDIYKPINGATVILKKGTTEVARYTTDQYYNGAFVFDGIEPGEYIIQISHPDYKDSDPEVVTVSAAKTVCPSIRIVNKDYVAPTENYDDFADPAAELGTYLADEIKFSQNYVDLAIDALDDKTVRRVVADKELLYILATATDGTPTVIKFNTTTKVAEQLSTSGIATVSDGLALSDIAVTSDHVLVGINQTPKAYNGASPLAAYKWDDNGNVTKWFDITTANAGGNWSNGIAGESMCYRGTSQEGTMYWTGRNTATNGQIRTVVGSIIAGNITAVAHNATSAALYALNIGSVKLFNAPEQGKLFIASEKGGIINATIPAATEEPQINAKLDHGTGTASANALLYAGNALLAIPDVSNDSNVGVKLLNITDINAVSTVATINTSLGAVAGKGDIAAICNGVYDDYDVINDVKINLYAVRAGKITRLSAGTTDQPVSRAALAYNLKSKNLGDGKYELSFDIAGKVKDAAIVLTNTADNSTRQIAINAVEGANTHTVDITDSDNYSWAVSVESPVIVSGGVAFSHASSTTQRGGVVPITDPEYDSYGYTIVANGLDHSIDVFDPAGNHKGTYFKGHSMFNQATNQSSPFRGSEYNGKAVFADWADSGSELPVVDPMDLSTLTSLYDPSSTKASSGNHTLNGVSIGGGQSGVGFTGKGESTKVYTFEEDAYSNQLVRYDIGTSPYISRAQDCIFSGSKSLLANNNVDILGYGNGVFASQIRYSGNNVAGCPCFAYYTIDGNLVFTSASVSTLDSSNSGIAITADGKTFAVGQSQSTIQIYDVTWSNDVPAFKLRASFSPSAKVSWSHMRFDAAGNLHVYERENAGYKVYAVPAPQRVAVTPAKSTDILAGIESGVEDIVIDHADADGKVTYYNLNGIAVDPDNLTPGIYVKVTGKKATKVVIK